MANLTSSLIVRLIDQVSGPARGIARAIRGLNDQANGNFGERIARSAAQTNRALYFARGRLVDAGAGFYALRAAIGAPVSAAADFETALEDIAQKAGIPQSRLASLGESIRQVARDTNQATMSIASAVDNLVGRGATEDIALAASGPIGRAATAYRASTDDLAAASWAVVDNLAVPADQIGTAIDMMAQSGKEGAFELRDMARYFPGLAAQYQGLGQTGVGAVADLASVLQVVRKGTGDASGAATNLQNVLQKVYSNTTIRGFEKLGLDIRSEMAAAADAGMTPIEAIAEITNDALGGDLSRLGEIFEDAQVQAGMRSLIQNMDEYRRIRDAASSASGVVNEDFSRRLRTAQGVMDRWNASLENFSISIGATLVPLLSDVLDRVVPIIDRVGEWAQANPDLARTALAVAASLVAVKVAATGLTFVGLLGKSGALSMLSFGFNTVGRAAIGASRGAKDALGAMSGQKLTGFQKFTTALRGMALAVPGISILGSALSAIGAGIAAISLPVAVGVAAVVAAIAGAGLLLWKYWDRITSVMAGVGTVIADLIPDFELTLPHAEKFAKLGEGIGQAWEGAKTAISGIGTFIRNVFDQETLTEEQKEKMFSAGRDWAQGMVDGAKQKIAELVEWFKGLPGMILNSIGTIDIGKAFTNTFNLGGGQGGPDLGNAVINGQVTDLPSPTGHRANGGNVWAGGSFLVGENEPEIFSPKSGGTITPLSQVGGGGGRRFNIENLNIYESSNPQATARAVAEELERMARGAHSDSEAWA